jgi:hypothetical protein
LILTNALPVEVAKLNALKMLSKKGVLMLLILTYALIAEHVRTFAQWKLSQPNKQKP